MAEPVSTTMPPILSPILHRRLLPTRGGMAKKTGCLLLLAGLVALSSTHAENLPDPTQPPASLAAGMGDTDSGDASTTPRLQSVLISPERKLAVINGKTVRLGEKYGTAVLVKITENGAVLRDSGVNQTLKLFPDLKKRSGNTAKPAKPTASARGNKVKER